MTEPVKHKNGLIIENPEELPQGGWLIEAGPETRNIEVRLNGEPVPSCVAASPDRVLRVVGSQYVKNVREARAFGHVLRVERGDVTIRDKRRGY